MEIEESGVVISRDELIVDEPAPFAAVDLPIAPVMSDENFSAAGVKVLIIQTPPSDEVASLEVPLVAVEAEEHSIPIIVNNEPTHMFYSKHTIPKLKKVKASIKLQSAWRTSLQYDKFIRVVAGIQVIQSSVRVLCARQRLVDVAVFHFSL